MYYKNKDGALLVYDITQRNTLNVAMARYDDIRQLAGPEMPIVLVGNKVDAEQKRQVLTRDGQDLADELNLSFFEVSSKDNENVAKVRLSCKSLGL